MNHHSTRQRVGLAIAALMNLASLPSGFASTPDGELGPPDAVLVLGSVLSLVGLVAVVIAWRGNRAALRVAAGALILGAITSLPALFVDIPLWLKLAAAVSVVLTVVAVLLMFSPTRRPVPVLD